MSDILPYKFDAFLSYAKEDEAVAQKLVKDMERCGLRIWFDSQSLIGGQRWPQVIHEAVEGCRYFLALISTHWHSRPRFAHDELKLALKAWSSAPNRSQYIIPILLEDVTIPIPLVPYHVVKLFPTWETGVDTLRRTFISLPSDVEETILGFDLGHGESAFAMTTALAKDTPRILDINGQSSILTAVALDEDNRILLGDEAYECRGPKSLALAFKHRDMTDHERLGSLRLFVSQCFRVLEESGKLRKSPRTVVVVGVPSGWTETAKEQYEHLLRECGIPNVELRPESRAAFLDAYEDDLLPKNLTGYALIIDIGSSTTDYTVVKDFKEKAVARDFGHISLGAYLIDKKIFETMVHSEINDANALMRLFDANPQLKARCLIRCRQIKEKYFNREAANRQRAGTVDGYLSLGKKFPDFDIRINDKEMTKILESPINELGNQSWISCFRGELLRIRNEYKDPAIVLMTGGGSRMSFTVDICRDIFGGEKTKVCLEPMTAIARGLALTGRIDRKISRFRKEISNYLDSASFEHIIRGDLPRLCKMLAGPIFNIVVDISLKRFREWQEENISTLEVMEQIIKRDIQEYMKGEGRAHIEKQIQEWFIGISRDIEAEVRNICIKYNVPEVAFGLKQLSSTVEIDSSGIKYSDLMDGPAQAVSAIVLGIVTIVLGSSVLSMSGIFVPIIGVIIAIVAGSFLIGGTMEKIESDMKKWNVVKPVRHIIGEQKMIRKIYSQRDDIEKQISTTLETHLLAHKVSTLLEVVRKQLNENADRISQLIT